MIRFASRPTSPFRNRVRLFLLGAAVCCASSAMAAPQVADDDEAPGSVSRPVVEPTAPSAGKALNDALGHLARDPRNVGALLEAGNAALALGDNEAALGFFTRADQVSPNNATVKVAIAGARLHLDDPVEALRWYAEAQAAGAEPSAFALDRGLAFDLVGDNAASIAQYRLVLARSRDAALRDEATRREALSLAIGGDRRSADMALLPLLQRQDRAAWRTHIFVLAIGGRGEDAVGVAHATMPPELAESISPYLRFMVRLTPAQQAAAASLGRFPRAADIGRDDARVTAYAAAHPRVPLTVTSAPVLAKATPTAADIRNARRKHLPITTTTPTPAALPDVAMPTPPPPVMMASNTGPTPAPSAGHAPTVVARIAPVVPTASRDTTTHRSAFDVAQASGSARTPTPAPLSAGSQPMSPRVPQPAVLSKLDMPPPGHRAYTPPAAHDAPTPPITTQYFGTPQREAQTGELPAVQSTGPAMVSSPVVQSTPRAVVAQIPAAAPTPQPVTTAPPTQVASAPATFAAAIPEPTAAGSELPAVSPTATPVVQPIPAPVETAPVTQHAVVEPIPATVEQPPKPKPIPEKVIKEKVEPAKPEAPEPKPETPTAKSAKDSKAKIKAAKDKAAAEAADKEKALEKEKAETKGKKGKGAKGAAAKDADDQPALEPCKPATPAKGRKGRAAAHSEPAHSARGRSAHGKTHARGKAHADDDDQTCAPVAKGERPDGPGDVSRDNDSDDNPKLTAKEAKKEAAKAKGKKGKDTDSDKAPEKGEKGRKAHYASRIWVQVLTGGDRDKMAGEWRSFVHKAHSLKGHKAYITPWHSNFRLLTGPFDSDAEAQDFIAQLRKEGVPSYEWTSPAGQAIDSLGS